MSATPPDWADSVTILAARGKRLAKVIRPDRTILDYDKAFRFDATTVTLAGLQDIRHLLEKLLPRSERAVVRGALIDCDAAENIRRLVHPDEKTSDAATLRDVPRRWLALDADGVARPDDVAPTDLLACADAVIDRLPPAFSRAACIVQATGSHAIKPGCRLRLWYWCDRPLAGDEAARWLEKTPCDPSVFRCAQLIYTAAPVFSPGVQDHLPARLIEWPGEDWLRCPDAEALAAPKSERPNTDGQTVAGNTSATKYGRGALIKAADAILQAREGKRHLTITVEAANLARLVHAGVVAESDVRTVLRRAAEGAGKNDADEIESAINWGLANPAHGKLPEHHNAA
jgi:hypothetical protein